MVDRIKKKKSVLLRIDPELWNDLNQWANDELRSLNGQIEYTLRKSVRRRKKLRQQTEKEHQERKPGLK
ncbi:MAG TPA: Arc family DNA-binding protein [Anaerolineae bacterium]|nr:Arc family DNA-binding protein [Anaerolineae bacterium]